MHKKYLSEKLSEEQLQSELGNPESEFYFAENNDEILGYLKLNSGNSQTENKTENSIEIERIYVLKEFLRMKIGQLLLDHSIQIAKEKNAEFILQIASLLSTKVQTIDSEKRKNLHIAAVFACNFTNHLYTLASELMLGSGANFNDLLPLIEETTNKLCTLSPYEAQTGPAVRQDTNIVAEHIAQLAKTDINKATIYALLSRNIMQTHKMKNKE